MSDGLPTRRGIATGGAGPPATRRLRVSSNPLFWTVRAVMSASAAPCGAGTIETVPTIMLPMYWAPAAGRGTGLGPRGLGPAPRPFALVTNRVRPSRDTVTVVGYQAVGMRPVIRGGAPAAGADA